MGKLSTKLTFAVQPIDAFAPQKKVSGKCDVSIVGVNKQPIENKSGFYCFTDLPEGEYDVKVKNKYYVEKEIEICI